MKLYFMKQKSLDSLQKDITDNLYNYQSKKPWVDQYFIDKESPHYFFDTGKEINDYQLIIGGSETDFQNAKIIHEAYKDVLNPVLASDLRLWAYLAHVQHWDYMYNRWKIDVPDEEVDEEKEDGKKSPKGKTANRIKSRYFFGNSRGKAYVRQGIARLYWSAYLTYDKNNENPYEYTEFFFSKQDIFLNITERSYARNKVLVLAALKELKKHPELSRNDIRYFLVRLNQSGAITVLDFLDEKQARELCASIMSEVQQAPKIMEGSSFKAYHIITGKAYVSPIKIINGKVTSLGNPLKTKPQSLIGKKEGDNFVISGQKYKIKEIL